MMAKVTLESKLPLVCIDDFVSTGVGRESSKTVAESLEHYGAVLIRDSRVTESDSARFLDMMERYFAQQREQKLKDTRPEFYYQVGATPDYVERPRDNSTIASKLAPEHRPRSDPSSRGKDPKWRFFWRLGERPENTKFPQLNAPQVIPDAFRDEWESTMNEWGAKLLSTLFDVAQLLALGLGLDRDAISEKMRFGPHLLAPTGSDMFMYGDALGTSIAGYHYDLNILTIHGRSRYPGLYIWTRDGVRLPVEVPQGTLLVQAGAQLEHLTAGRIQKGMHEVIVSEETAAAARVAQQEGKSRWRVSSTLFGHVGSDESLKPIINWQYNPNDYPDIKAGEQVANELRAIELAAELKQ